MPEPAARRAAPPPGNQADRPAALGRVSNEIHQFAESLGQAIDARDHHTKLHSEEVAVVGYTLALGLGLSPALADLVHIAGHLHDIGKIGIPDRVLLKPGKLSAEERLLVERHPAIGAAILAPVDFLAKSGIVAMVRSHHERFDGRGYPDGLARARIPLGARVIAVADSLSAMLQDRPYRAGLPWEEAVTELGREAGKRYDPVVVNVFWKQREQIREFLRLTRLEYSGALPCPACCPGPASARGAHRAA